MEKCCDFFLLEGQLGGVGLGSDFCGLDESGLGGGELGELGF